MTNLAEAVSGERVPVAPEGEVNTESPEGGDLAREGTSKAVSKLTRNQVDKLVEDIGGSIKNHPLRQEYENAVAGLKDMGVDLRRQGLSDESIARELSQARRELGVTYKELTLPELREYIYEVNIGRYKDPLGPKFEDLVKRYDGDYTKIIEAAQRPNPNVDNLLGGFKEWLIKKNGL
jgi:hypothetical protein